MIGDVRVPITKFRKNWRENLLRVQAGEDIKVTKYGDVLGVMKSNLNFEERIAAKAKLAELRSKKAAK